MPRTYRIWQGTLEADIFTLYMILLWIIAGLYTEFVEGPVLDLIQRLWAKPWQAGSAAGDADRLPSGAPSSSLEEGRPDKAK